MTNLTTPKTVHPNAVRWIGPRGHVSKVFGSLHPDTVYVCETQELRICFLRQNSKFWDALDGQPPLPPLAKIKKKKEDDYA